MATHSSTDPVRLLLVGCGKHASVVMHTALQFNAHFRVVACCDADKVRVETTAARFGNVPAHTDVGAMLAAEQADAALIVLPPEVQGRVTLQCLEAGLHVYVEKPLAVEHDEARAIVEAARRADRQCMVGFMKRFNHVYQRLKQVIDSEDFGRSYLFQAKFTGGYRPQPTDLLRVGAVHTFDLARFFMGDLASVHAYQCESAPGRAAMAISARFTSGAVGLFHLNSTTVWFSSGEYVEIAGERNFASVDNSHALYWQGPPEFTEQASGQQDPYEEPSLARVLVPTYTHVSQLERQTFYRNGYYPALDHFATALQSGAAALPDATDGLRSLEACLAVERSLEGGKPVALASIAE